VCESTAIYESLGDSRALALVNRLFALLQQKVTAGGGAVVKTLGDGMVCQFPDADAAFRPGTPEVAVIRLHGSQSTVFRLASGSALFNGTGAFDQVIWSPDGRWLLVTWPTADQWVFVRGDGRRIRAVSNVSEQFRSRSFPRIEGWCCAR